MRDGGDLNQQARLITCDAQASLRGIAEGFRDVKQLTKWRLLRQLEGLWLATIASP